MNFKLILALVSMNILLCSSAPRGNIKKQHNKETIYETVFETLTVSVPASAIFIENQTPAIYEGDELVYLPDDAFEGVEYILEKKLGEYLEKEILEPETITPTPEILNNENNESKETATHDYAKFNTLNIEIETEAVEQEEDNTENEETSNIGEEVTSTGGEEETGENDEDTEESDEVIEESDEVTEENEETDEETEESDETENLELENDDEENYAEEVNDDNDDNEEEKEDSETTEEEELKKNKLKYFFDY
ncbi:hypothetical protein BCR36DRAFT_588561 [Piromyces finnis]|uniref:Uncharacterized protein n=1 Tax=Piromyces finnis TaxID=1754191 RepID=A0A1Y1U8H3_9FUNG|nr:hypothetical protein BCR36DRAFT_588561 [Piromyces finnis]|eukprot:ORX34339.1 hypothetical protein BCR36DRAFT_588561 [Piromyces finnis]